jgi:endonuclease/exonuclease/phosphatase family metal-dependent hydrolase
MTRILTYNILVGGTRRIDQITQVIRAAQPDVVGLVEAIDPRVVEELAKRLGLEYRTNKTAQPGPEPDYSLALLSRLPVVFSHVHRRPGILSKPALEVGVREENGHELIIFVTHLQASFANSARGGDNIRREEARELLRIMRLKQGTPHLLMGDFNSISPGDDLEGSRLLRYLIEMDERRKQGQDTTGHPHLNFVVPPSLRFLNPLLLKVPQSRRLSTLFDGAAPLYTSRGTMRLLRAAGYVDCYRRINPHAQGFTCPARAPSGRIDYIMASPSLAARLTDCYVLSEGNGTPAYQASDHLPVIADFGEPVELQWNMHTPVVAGETSE